MTTTSERFCEYILAERQKRGLEAWRQAYNSLIDSPAQLRHLTFYGGKAPIEMKFIQDFDRVYAERLYDFIARRNTGLPHDDLGTKSAELAVIFIRELILPLLQHQYQHLHSLDSMLDLLIAVLDMAAIQSLKALAAQLSNVPVLLGKILCSDRSNGFRATWIQSLGNTRPIPATTLASWTNIMASLVSGCSHAGITRQLEMWEKLKPVMDELRSEIRGLTYQNKKEAQYSADTRRAFTEFGLPTSTSVSSAQRTLETIETQITSQILMAIGLSLPCRPCFDYAASGKNFSASHERHGPRQPTGDIAAVLAEDGEDLTDVGDILGSSIGIWKISLSAAALKDLQASQHEGNFLDIKAKLEDLATGDWVRRSVARPLTIHTRLPCKVRLFQAQYNSNGLILWQVDCGFDVRRGTESQIVRVWRIGDWKEIRKSLDIILRAQAAWSSERIAACKVNYLDKAQGIKLPKIFTTPVNFATNLERQGEGLEFDYAHLQDLDHTLISSKFHALTNKVFDNIQNCVENADFPYDESIHESEIIRNHESAVFILGRSGTGKTTCLLYKLLARYIASKKYAQRPLRQVLVTRSVHLAEKLKSELRGLIRAQLAGAGGSGHTPLPQNSNVPLPDTLVALNTPDFPLVCTYSAFVDMTENTIRSLDRQNFSLRNTSTNNLVDFDIFESAYWPRLRVHAQRERVIKGTASLRTSLKPLTRNQYLELGPRLAPAYPSDEAREVVYDLYEEYEKVKRRRAEYDVVDRLIKILNALNNNLMELLENVVDEIYVDEVQDQRPIEIELLLQFVRSPNGIHFAGDTAQCISNDSVFRFPNLKALFYTHYAGKVANVELAKPTLFKLARNFRSHQGILSLASFVVDLLSRGFPTMVDKLSPEVGDSMGPSPIVFVGANVLEFLAKAGSSIAKRAQIILVRGNKEMSTLESVLGKNSVIFTILQSKGMEWDEVFLYNFFSSSPCSSEYRNMSLLLPENEESDYNPALMMSSELRNLYVAITRPRQRLWILESEPSYMIDFFTSRRPSLVSVRSLSEDTSKFPALLDELQSARTTSTADWIRDGIQCMERRLFSQAIRCFHNAGDRSGVRHAEASLAAQEAKRHRAVGDYTSAKSKYEEAIIAFLELNMQEQAADCYEACGKFEEAAEIWSMKGRHGKAAELFSRAGDRHINRAANEYYKANLPYLGIRLLVEHKKYEDVILGLKKYRTSIEPLQRLSIAKNYNDLARKKNSPIPHLKEAAFDLFDEDEKITFLKEYNYIDELIEVYCRRAMLDEALDYLLELEEYDRLFDMAVHAEPAWRKDNEVFLSAVFNCYFASRLARQDFKDEYSEPSSMPWAKQWLAANNAIGYTIRTYSIPESRIDERTMSFISVAIVLGAQDILRRATNVQQVHFLIETTERFATGLTSFLDDANPAYLAFLGIFRKNASQYFRMSSSLLPAPKTGLGKIFMPQQSQPLQPPKVFSVLILHSAFVFFSTQIQNAINTASKKLMSLSLLDNVDCSRCDYYQPHLKESYTCNCCQQSIEAYQPYLNGMANLYCFTSNFLRPTIKRLQDLDTILGSSSKLSESFKKATWLDNICNTWVDDILTHLTYESSLAQNVSVIYTYTKFKNKLVNEPTYRPLMKSIELKLNSDANKVVDDTKRSRSLNLYHLSEFLKCCQLYSLFGFDLNDKVWLPIRDIMRRFEHYSDPQTWTPSVAALRFHYLDLCSIRSPSQLLPEALHKRLHTLLHCLRVTKITGNSSYEASVISIYEAISTLLLACNAQNGLLIPQIWALLYLRRWEVIVFPGNGLQRLCYGTMLVEVLSAFVDMMTSWELLLETGPVKNRGRNQRLRRRAIELVLIGLSHISRLRTEPSGFSHLKSQLDKFFQLPIVNLPTVANLLDRGIQNYLAAWYAKYQGKDSLWWFCSETSPLWYPGRQRRRRMESAGIEFKKWPGCHNRAPRGVNAQEQDQNLAPLLTTCCAAAALIWSAYRKYRARCDFMNSREGKAIRELQTILNLRWLSKREGKKISVYRQAVGTMTTEGVPVYLQMQNIYDKLLAKVKQLKATELHDFFSDWLQSLDDKINRPWEALFENVHAVAFDVPDTSLRIRLAAAERTCSEVATQIHDIDEVVEFYNSLQAIYTEYCRVEENFNNTDIFEPYQLEKYQSELGNISHCINEPWKAMFERKVLSEKTLVQYGKDVKWLRRIVADVKKRLENLRAVLADKKEYAATAAATAAITRWCPYRRAVALD